MMAESEVAIDKNYTGQGKAVITKCVFCCSDLCQKHNPFLLPCLHSSCQACLPLSQPTVQCGDCEIPFNPSDAVSHLVLLEKLEQDGPEEADTGVQEAHTCTSCDDDLPANGYCKDCEEWLCKACISAHQRVKVTKDHVILSIEEAGAALKLAARQKYQYCVKHPKELLKCYCNKCQILTCRDCQLESHQSHDYLLLSAAWEQQKPQLKILQERIAEKQAFLREYVDTIERCQHANATAETKVGAEIKQYAVKAITIISARTRQLMKELRANCDQKREQLHHRKQEFMSLCKRLLDCHSVVDELLSSGSELTLVHSKRIMEKHMSQLIDHTVSLPTCKAEIHLKFMYDPKEIETLGGSAKIVDLSTIRSTPTVAGRHLQVNGARMNPMDPSKKTAVGVVGSGVAVERRVSSGFPPSQISVTSMDGQTPRDIVAKSSSASGGRPTPTASPAVPDQSKDADAQNREAAVGKPSTNAAPVAAAPVAPPQEDNSDDWCAICHDGGELLCCGSCPKVYHLNCHVPTLVSTPSEDWKCTLCTIVEDDAANNTNSKEVSGSKRKIPVGLSGRQLRICEKILLQLFCHNSSTPFQTPVSRTVPNYFKIITRPMDLSTVKQKLSAAHFNHYDSAASFIADIKLIFNNCYTFNAKESQLSQTAKALEQFFNQLIATELPECLSDLHSDNTATKDDETKRAKIV